MRSHQVLEDAESAQKAREEEKRAQEAYDEARRAQEESPGRARENTQLSENMDMSNRNMTWWRSAWWIRIEDGPTLRTAGGRRMFLVQNERDPFIPGGQKKRNRRERGVPPTELSKRQKERTGERKTDKETRKCNERTLHLVLHLLANASATATATTAEEAMRILKWHHLTIVVEPNDHTSVLKLKELVTKDEMFFFVINVIECVTKFKFDDWYDCYPSPKETDAVTDRKRALVSHGEVGEGCTFDPRDSGAREFVADCDLICGYS